MYTPEQQAIIKELQLRVAGFPFDRTIETSHTLLGKALLIILDKLDPLVGGAEMKKLARLIVEDING